MAKELNKAQVNHLRRLLGWVRCSEGVFQSPEEMVASLRKIAPHVGVPDEGAKQRLAESYAKAANVPKYVRAAIKALEPVVREAEGEIVEASRDKAAQLTVKAALPRPQPRLESRKPVERLRREPCKHGLWLCDLCPPECTRP